MAKDNLGTELEIGDLVIYVSGGRRTVRKVARVASVMSSKVVIIKIDPKTGSDAGREEMVYGVSCFAVTGFKANVDSSAK